MFKKIQEKWAQFQINFKEYMKLRKECHEFDCMLNDAQRKITSYSTGMEQEPLNQPRCIRVFYSVAPVFSEQENKFTPYYSVNYCKEFDKSNVVPCTNNYCKFCKENHEYYDALVRYTAARDCRRAFWRGNKSITK